MTLRNPFIGTVAGVIEKERRVLVGFPLNEVGGAKIRGLVGLEWAPGSATAATAAVTAHETIPGVGGDLHVPLQVVVAFETARFAPIFRANHHFLRAQNVAELTEQEGFPLTFELRFQASQRH